MKPRLFIASSTERLELAYAAQENLEHDAEITVWTQGVFGLSRTAMASLIDQLEQSDFGLFVLAPDDLTIIRDKAQQTPRDNIVLELGLFIGRLGVERCFLVAPRGVDDLHLPTDLLGLTPAEFSPDRQDGNMVAALGPACNRVRRAIAKMGNVTAAQVLPLAEPPIGDLMSDPNDCLSAIEGWMGDRPATRNILPIRFTDVDRELKLAPGSARRYLEQAARKWNYQVARVGKDTILFEPGPLY